MYNIIYNIKAGHSEKTKKSCHSESVFWGDLRFIRWPQRPQNLLCCMVQGKKSWDFTFETPFWRLHVRFQEVSIGNVCVCRQAMDMEMLGLPKSPRVMTQAPQESIKIQFFLVSVVGSMIFNTPRGVDQISRIDSFCYWLVAKTFQK